jgi:hypothetical protein
MDLRRKGGNVQMRFWEVIMAGGCGSGIGSIILDKVGIGQGSFNIVGAEVVVTKDVPNKKNCNMYTIPTRVVKDALRNYCLIKQYIIKQHNIIRVKIMKCREYLW